MTEKRYGQLIHLLAAGIAVVLWFVSVQFSVDGFNFALPQVCVDWLCPRNCGDCH